MIAPVYFLLFLAHALWRLTIHNHALENLGLDGQEIGVLFALGYVPGILAFALGIAAGHFSLHFLLLLAGSVMAMGLLIAGSAAGFASIAAGAFFIALGFTGFYTLANATYLLDRRPDDPAASLGKLKSLGPLAGIAAGLILLVVFAPRQLLDILSASNTQGGHAFIASLFAFTSAKPAVDPTTLRLLLLTSGVILLFSVLSCRHQLSHCQHSARFAHFSLRRRLLPFYLLNLVSGCRSAIFQTFALYVMVAEFNLPIHGTAALMMLSYLCSFAGYRAVGVALQALSHRTVLSVIYLAVAANFTGFWYFTGPALLNSSQALLTLGTLFLIDSAFFGASVVTDSHLRKTGGPADYVGDVATGTTLFYVAAMSMSLIGAALWKPLGHHAFLLGTLCCLLGFAVSQWLSIDAPSNRGPSSA